MKSSMKSSWFRSLAGGVTLAAVFAFVGCTVPPSPAVGVVREESRVAPVVQERQLVVGTWNGEWFPSHRAEHRANPEVEEATIRASGKMLAKAIARFDTNGTEDVIIVLNEIRDREVAERLAAVIGRNLKVATITDYRNARGRGNYQQDVILTTLPVAESSWENWQPAPEGQPPRGFASAALVVEPAVTSRVYATHLKSNYRASDAEAAAWNRAMRLRAVEQFVARERGEAPVLLAGDFNADKWRKQFAGEPLFPVLETNGFVNVMETLPKRKRYTFPSRTYGNSALDYVMLRGFELIEPPVVVPNDELSDHYALFAHIRVK